MMKVQSSLTQNAPVKGARSAKKPEGFSGALTQALSEVLTQKASSAPSATNPDIASEAKNSLSEERTKEAEGWFVESTKSPQHWAYYLSDAQKKAWIRYELEQYVIRGNMIAEIGNYRAENYASKS